MPLPLRTVWAAPTGLLLLAACSGHTMYSSSTQVSPLGPPEAYDCAQTQFKAMGYKTLSHDDTELRLVAQKRDTVTKISSTQLRKILDQIEIQAKPLQDGRSELKVEARSLEEVQNAGGIQQNQREASAQVKADAVTLLQQCQATSDSTVPSAGY